MLKGKLIVWGALILFAVLSLSCKQELVYVVDDNTALRLHKRKLRSYIIDFNLDAAIQYCNDLIHSGNPVYKDLGSRYIFHIAGSYYKLAKKLYSYNMPEDSESALLNAMALDSSFVQSNENDGLQRTIAPSLIERRLKMGDKENALLYYRRIKQKYPGFYHKETDDIIKSRRSEKGKDVHAYLEKLTKSGIYKVTAQYTYLDEKEGEHYESIESAALLVETNKLLCVGHAVRPTIVGVLPGKVSLTLDVPGMSNVSCSLFSYDGVNNLALIMPDEDISLVPTMRPGDYYGESPSVSAGDKIYASAGMKHNEILYIIDEVVTTRQPGWQAGRWFQVDSVFPREFTGAPVFRDDNKMIGLMASYKTDKEESAYIIPVDTIRSSLYHLLQGRAVPASRVGIVLDDDGVNRLGPVIRHVFHNSAAADAGLAKGDIITHVNKTPVSTAADIQKHITFRDEGAVCSFRVKRGELRKDFYMVSVSRASAPTYFGFRKTDPYTSIEDFFGFAIVKDGRGSDYTVTKVLPSSPAQRLGFRPEERCEVLYNFYDSGKQFLKIRYYHGNLGGNYKLYILESTAIQHYMI